MLFFPSYYFVNLCYIVAFTMLLNFALTFKVKMVVFLLQSFIALISMHCSKVCLLLIQSLLFFTKEISSSNSNKLAPNHVLFFILA